MMVDGQTFLEGREGAGVSAGGRALRGGGLRGLQTRGRGLGRKGALSPETQAPITAGGKGVQIKDI